MDIIKSAKIYVSIEDMKAIVEEGYRTYVLNRESFLLNIKDSLKNSDTIKDVDDLLSNNELRLSLDTIIFINGSVKVSI